MKNSTVIYHSADYDGIFCREIAKKFLPNVTLIGWNFGDPLIKMPDEGLVYILDLSPDCLCELNNDHINRLVWIDHHKTSIDKWSDLITGYRIDGVAACRLTWQWFNRVPYPTFEKQWCELPCKEFFIDRVVKEPLAVRLAGEYDIWDKRNPDAETFQYGLRSCDEINWEAILTGNYVTENMIEGGKVCQKYAQKTDASICKSRSFRIIWHGLDFLCLNSARFNSLSFAALDTIENGHDALMGFCWNGKCWTVSLYHAKNRTLIDLSVIAKQYGGGGHKGACGFTCKTLPFNL